MDRIKSIKDLKNVLSKYKTVFLVILLGIIFMSFPLSSESAKSEKAENTAVNEKGKIEELEEILCQIQGVGKVKVMLTESCGAETVYQMNEDLSISDSSETIRKETVMISTSDRNETGLIRTISPPVYLGAIIVCQGGDRPVIQLAVIQAVSNVTGIPTDRISVLKMK